MDNLEDLDGVLPEEQTRLSRDEFGLLAIDSLRKGKAENGKEYMGIHTVNSRFNEAFRVYFGGTDRPCDDKHERCNETCPVGWAKSAIARGVIVGHPCKGGFAIRRPEHATQLSPQAVLKKMGLK